VETLREEAHSHMAKPECISFRCPECEHLTRDAILTGASSVLICAQCGNVTERWGLVAGDDGVCGLKPEPPEKDWAGRFIAVYPDGSRKTLDLDGHVMRPGEQIPGGPFVLDRWDVTDEPVEEGRFEIIGVLKDED
jgi:ribosomal protein S27E